MGSQVVESTVSFLATHAGEIIGGIIITVVAFVLKLAAKKMHVSLKAASKKPNFHRHYTASAAVRDLLIELRIRHKASRALVFMFHNGESFFNGKSLAKMSCYSESCAPGSTSISNSCKGVLISTTPEAVSFIYTAHPNTAEVIKDTRWHAITRDSLEVGQLAASFDESGVVVAMHRILYDSNIKSPEPIGFVSLQFSNTDNVSCEDVCPDSPCAEFPPKEFVELNNTMCEEWDESSKNQCNQIEKRINASALQVSWSRRFIGALFSKVDEPNEK